MHQTSENKIQSNLDLLNSVGSSLTHVLSPVQIHTVLFTESC